MFSLTSWVLGGADGEGGDDCLCHGVLALKIYINAGANRARQGWCEEGDGRERRGAGERERPRDQSFLPFHAHTTRP